MAYNPLNPNGQATMANSQPFVIASDQSPVSVAGTVTVGNLPTTQNVSGSVAAFVVGNSSVITVAQSSVAVAIVSGSIAASFTPPANQSVSGTVQVDVRSSVATVIIGGSIATATTNSSVMLLNGANTIGSVTTLQGTNPWIVTSSIAGGIFPISGSVAATITNTNVNVSGSVVAFLGNSTNASVITVGTAAVNQSVSGTVQANLLSSNASVITVGQGSIAVAIISGSVATATTNSSVMLLNGTNTIGSVVTVTKNFLHSLGTNGYIITPVSIMSTELNSLTNTSIASSSVTGTNGKFSQTNFGSAQKCQIWIQFGSTLGATPASGANITGWWINSTDGGTTFESSVAAVGMSRPPDFIIPLTSIASAYSTNAIFYATGFPTLPFGSNKVIVINNAGTGANLPASGNILTVAPIAEQF